MAQGSENGNWCNRMAATLTVARQLGADADLRGEVIAFCRSLWPRADWERYR